MTPPPEVTPLELLRDEKYADALEQVFDITKRIALNELIPPYMHRGLVRYILLGEFPGSFLITLLKGDLFGTLAYADSTNIKILHQYGDFLYNNAPRLCFGDAETVLEWNYKGGQLEYVKAKDLAP